MILVILLFCLDYYIVYKKTLNVNKNLSKKQKAYILSIKSSFTLFITSIYFNIKFANNNFNIENYSNNLTSNDIFISDLTICNLISYFIMDCFIGHIEYHDFLCSLSGYIHHIVYIIISLLSMYVKEMNPLYMLYMIEELPTLLLAIGNFNKNLRHDNLFGFTFFTLRIVYHIILTINLRYDYLFLSLGTTSLLLHSYWFKNWICKYFFISKEDNTKLNPQESFSKAKKQKKAN